MEVKRLERDAYVATLRALIAQGGDNTLEKEKLKVLLKKVLHISDEVHLECLEKAMTEKKPKAEGSKKQKGHHAAAAGFVGGAKFRKSDSKAGIKTAKKKESKAPIDEFIGKKVKRYWPDDGGWLQGVISDYNIETGEHCIIYDMGTPNESWEWYNVRHASSEACQVLEGEKVNLTSHSLEELEKLKTDLKAKEADLQQQLKDLEGEEAEEMNSGDITYSDSD